MNAGAGAWKYAGVSSLAFLGAFLRQPATPVLPAIEAPEFPAIHAIQLTVELAKADSKFLPAGSRSHPIFAKAAQAMPGANDVIEGGREGLSVGDCHEMQGWDLRSRHHATSGQAATSHRHVRRTRV
jgi:hypothetical protein